MSAIEITAEIMFRAGGACLFAAVVIFLFCVLRYMQRNEMSYRALRASAVLFFGSGAVQMTAAALRPELEAAGRDAGTARLLGLTFTALLYVTALAAALAAVRMFERPERTQKAWKVVADLAGRLQRLAQGKVIEDWPDVVGEQGDGDGEHVGR